MNLQWGALGLIALSPPVVRCLYFLATAHYLSFPVAIMWLCHSIHNTTALTISLSYLYANISLYHPKLEKWVFVSVYSLCIDSSCYPCRMKLVREQVLVVHGNGCSVGLDSLVYLAVDHTQPVDYQLDVNG